VGIGVGAHGDGLDTIALVGELAPQRLDGVDLHVDVALEVEPRRVTEIGVGLAGEAIRTPMLAAAIGIDGAIEPDVRAVVAGDDRARPLDMLDRLEPRQRLDRRVPAVVEAFPLLALEPAGAVGLRPATARARGVD